MPLGAKLPYVGAHGEDGRISVNATLKPDLLWGARKLRQRKVSLTSDY
jgi:hypothetical protein